MKTTQSSGTGPDHQTVAGTFEFKTNGKAIAIGFTEQQLSPHAGSALFWGWLHRLDWRRCLADAWPHPRPLSNNHLLPLEKALAFMHGLLCAARKLTHVSYLRREPLVPELLDLWEPLPLPYVGVAQLSQPIQKLIKGDLSWTATEVPGTEVAQLEYQAMSWPQPRRLVLLRHRVSDHEERGGKRLLDAPGYRFQALATSLPASTHPPLAVWRYYNGRADCENVIKELQAGFALPTLCLEEFWASEAALSLACLTCNLIVLFERQLGWQQK